MGKQAGDPDRIAALVAANRQHDRNVTMALIEDTSFDAHDAGPIAVSWRQQTGSPSYCTEVTLPELPKALAAADLLKSHRRSDLTSKVCIERLEPGYNPGRDFVVKLPRLLQVI